MIDLQSAEYLNVRTAFRVYLENWNVIFFSENCSVWLKLALHYPIILLCLILILQCLKVALICNTMFE